MGKPEDIADLHAELAHLEGRRRAVEERLEKLSSSLEIEKLVLWISGYRTRTESDNAIILQGVTLAAGGVSIGLVDKIILHRGSVAQALEW
jgi:hypothetical protein